MKTLKALLTSAACALVLLLSLETPASAQRFSDWSAPVNLGPAINTASFEG